MEIRSRLEIEPSSADLHDCCQFQSNVAHYNRNFQCRMLNNDGDLRATMFALKDSIRLEGEASLAFWDCIRLQLLVVAERRGIEGGDIGF